MDFFDSLKQYLIFVLLCSTKILALLAARLAVQGFAGYSIPFEAGFFTVGPFRFPDASHPKTGGLPRKQLAFSATGSASLLSPRAPPHILTVAKIESGFLTV